MRQITEDAWSAKIFLPLVLVFILTLPGCGDDEAVCTAPAGSSIVLTGPAVFGGISADTCANINAAVFYPDGKPMPKACINVSGSFAFPRNTAVTNPRYQFYYYPDCNVVANNAVDSGFNAQTDDSGVYSFSALISFGTGTFKDEIFVRSGVNVNSIEIGIQ